MRLDRPTHVRKSNRSSGWMSDFTEEIAGQITAGIRRLGDGEYTFYSIYPLPSDAEYDEVVHPTEWIQTTGVAPDRLTVEVKKRDAEGVHRLYTVGRADSGTESVPSEPITNGDNTYLILPSEVLTVGEAVELFQSYYDTHDLPSGWALREQPEFADTALAAGPSAGGATAAGPASTGRAPVSESRTSKAKGKAKPKEQGEQ